MMNKQKLAVYIIIICLALIIGAAGGYIVFISQKMPISPDIKDINEIQAKDSRKLLLGVIVENEISSRPFHEGLSDAQIVYEALAEGGITRFFAIFDPDYEKKIGPVRSARPYFIDFAHEYESIFAHVGGSDEALKRLRKEKIFDVEQFLYEKDKKYFWRENVGKTALEHTMFTSGKALQQIIKEKVWQRTGTTSHPLLIRSEQSSELNIAPAATKISIDFGFPTYSVQYEYDAAMDKYWRFQAKKPHIDHGNEQQIVAAAVIIQRVKAQPKGDSKGHIAIKTIDEGEAVIFQKGRVIKGTWQKKSLEKPTEFFDENGRQIYFSEGPIWVEVLPLNNAFSYL